MKPKLILTLGDPLGIGPEIVEKALADREIQKLAQFQIVGTPKLSKANKKAAGLASWKALEEAVVRLKAGRADAVVTAPVSKTHLNLAGFPFPGQTEFLQSKFKAPRGAMMLLSPRLRVVLVTIHIPLQKVPGTLTTRGILDKILMTHESLKRDFGIKIPKVAICGLNPHASEGGMFGSEEKKIIIPAIQAARKKKINVSDPLPSDTVFHLALQKKYDAVVCHYHDQGLIALKTLDFDSGVNTTLGLPIVRTSPDHGCAFDIAGKGIANPESFKHAIRVACQMVKNRSKS